MKKLSTHKVLHAANVPKTLMRVFNAKAKMQQMSVRRSFLQLLRRVVSKDIELVIDRNTPDVGEDTSMLYVRKIPEQLHNSFASMCLLYGMKTRWAIIQLMRRVASGEINIRKE